MKTLLKVTFGLCAVVSTTIQQSASARMHHIWFDDSSFFDTSWMDEVMDFHRKSVESMRKQLADLGPSKEDREAIKAARESLAKIKHEVKEDDKKVTITFSGFDHLDKKDIKVIKKENGWLGVIITKDGKLEFYITAQGINVAKLIEIKRVEKAKEESKEKETEAKEVKEPKSERVFYSSSLASEGEYFKHLVDLSTLKAESVKNNSFTVTVEKEKEEVLQIP
jgi:hypothetical protein